ncbi:MAG TPA: hypothetical protein PKO07_03745 [Pseudomonadota bacterium]|nr:hypothetical protein [Pseudomonadota bacterium]HNN50107.1 hypothetical protein [Pseudomonadota bacterium]
MTRVLGTLVLASILSGCAAMSSNTTATGSVSADPAVASASQSLGIKDTLIQVAITAARNYLSSAGSAASNQVQDATAVAAQKEAAAKAGVQAAADKAKAEGSALSEPQQTGLLSVLKGML